MNSRRMLIHNRKLDYNYSILLEETGFLGWMNYVLSLLVPLATGTS
ncbi:MAG: hypothetical protein QXQ31_04815 [Zestosphaera sp.]